MRSTDNHRGAKCPEPVECIDIAVKHVVGELTLSICTGRRSQPTIPIILPAGEDITERYVTRLERFIV